MAPIRLKKPPGRPKRGPIEFPRGPPEHPSNDFLLVFEGFQSPRVFGWSAPKTAQEAAQEAPQREPQDGRRRPKVPQDAPETLLRELQEGPKKGNSNWPWEPLTPRWPQGPPTPKRPPRGLQEAPKRLPRGPRKPPRGPPKARALTRTPLHAFSNERVGFETHGSPFFGGVPSSALYAGLRNRWNLSAREARAMVLVPYYPNTRP